MENNQVMAFEELDPSNPNVADTKHWHALDDGRVQCDICPRHCKMREGQRGFCFVRANVADSVKLTTWGRSSGFCVDPIEKKPLNHFLPGSPVLSFGTAGCNLGCKFCQNWDISKSREFDTLASVARPQTLAEVARDLKCKSVAFTYNDPTIFMEYAIDVAEACHEQNIKTVAVTAGYITPEAREDFYRHLDAANVDLKAFDEDFYKKIAFGELGPVLDSLLYLEQETDVWYEITTLLIPDENDSPAEIEEMSQWIVEHLGPDTPLHFSAFHPDFKMRDKERTPASTLTRSREIAMKNGLRYVYTGNVHDESGASTYCPTCSQQLIGRDWYELTEWRLNDGKCNACGTAIPGVFDDDSPGDWGRRRLPVRLRDHL